MSSTYNGEPVALINVEDKYRLNKGEVVELLYGTKDSAHPNVAEVLHEFGEIYLGGTVRLVKRPRHV
ncbi:MAG: hypothetical protein QXP31_00755 [Pyrobaculum sp.]